MTDRPDRWSTRATLLFSGAVSLALWALIVLGAATIATAAHAQGAIQQAGPVVPFDLPTWLQNGVVSDAGGPGKPGVGQIGMFNGANCPFSISSQTGPGTSLTPYSQLSLCQSAAATTFTIAGLNGQPTPAVFFNIGGVSYPWPGPGNGNVMGPPSSVVNDLACFNAVTGTILSDCGVPQAINIAARYGAVPDGRIRNSCSITATQSLLTCLVNFNASEIGKTIAVNGAGAAGGELITTILSVAGPVATLNAPAASTTSGLYWQSEIDGTDNTTPFETAIAGLGSGGCLFFPPGIYIVQAGALSSAKQNWCLEGTINRTGADAQLPNIIMIGSTGSLMALTSPAQSISVTGLGLQYFGADYTGNLINLGVSLAPVSEITFSEDAMGGILSVLQGTNATLTGGTVHGPATAIINLAGVYNINIEKSLFKFANTAILGPSDTLINANTVRIRDDYFIGGFGTQPIIVAGQSWTIDSDNFEPQNNWVSTGGSCGAIGSQAMSVSTTQAIEGLVISGIETSDSSIGNANCIDLSQAGAAVVSGVSITGSQIGPGLNGVILGNGAGWNITGNYLHGLTSAIVASSASNGVSGNFCSNGYSSVTNQLLATTNFINPRCMDNITQDIEGTSGSITSTLLNFGTAAGSVPAGLQTFTYDIQVTTPGAGATLTVTLTWHDETGARTCVSSAFDASTSTHYPGSCIITANGANTVTYTVALAGGSATYSFRANLRAQ